MGRAPCCEKMGLKKGPWTPQEDQILVSFILQHGHSNWRALPKQAGLLRCGKSCRLRWVNYLKPDIKRGNFTKEEEDTIINLHQMLGNRWSAIAARLPGRTDNEIKNVWHTHLKKRLKDYQPKISKPENKKISNKSEFVIESKSINPKSESEPVNSSNPNNNSFSPSSSTSDISSVTLINGDVENKNIIETDSKEDNIGDCYSFDSFNAEIDESFWNETLYNNGDNSGISAMEPEISLEVKGFDELLQQEFQFDSVDDLMFLDGFGNDYTQRMDNGMEFWYDLLVKSGGNIEL